MKINPEDIIERNLNQDFSSIDDEVVMFSEEKGEFFALNNVASKIWEIIAKPTKTSMIVEQLMLDFEVDEKTCLNQTIDFLLSMKEKSLIRVAKNNE